MRRIVVAIRDSRLACQTSSRVTRIEKNTTRLICCQDPFKDSKKVYSLHFSLIFFLYLNRNRNVCLFEKYHFQFDVDLYIYLNANKRI